MAFNLNEFKSHHNRGFLSPNKYEFLIAGSGLRMTTDSVSIPALSFYNVDTIRPYGFGPTYTIPHGINFTEITASHLVEYNSYVHKFMERWLSNIVLYKRTGNRGANYLSDYSTTINIKTYTNNGDISSIYELREAFPASMDQIPLSWSTTDELVRLTVTYKFTEWHTVG